MTEPVVFFDGDMYGCRITWAFCARSRCILYYPNYMWHPTNDNLWWRIMRYGCTSPSHCHSRSIQTNRKVTTRKKKNWRPMLQVFTAVYRDFWISATYRRTGKTRFGTCSLLQLKVVANILASVCRCKIVGGLLIGFAMQHQIQAFSSIPAAINNFSISQLS